MSETPYEVIHTKSFVEEMAEYIVATIQADIKEEGRCVIGLCGGNTPKPVYAQIAKVGKDIDWKKVIITFGDERCVAADSAESNFRMAKECLLDAIAIPAENVLRMEGEIDPELAAQRYEKEIKDRDLVHDILLLGLGGDGHTASLFPDTAALLETEKLIIANYVPKLDSWRLTFTYKLINSSRRILFLVNDPSKKPVIDAILSGTSDFPAGKVAGTEQTIWCIG